MRKLLIPVFSILFLFASSLPALAACGPANICGAGVLPCRKADGTIYSCCDTIGDVCPAVPTAIPAPTLVPGAPTPDPQCKTPGLFCWSKAWHCPGICPFDCGSQCCLDKASCTSATLSPFCGGSTGINTALGCIDFAQPEAAMGTILTWATGLAAAIAFILIIIAAFQITTAAGDPKRVKAGQELLTSAIAGFILIALSVVILNFLGVNVLGLQNFGFQR